MNTKKTIITINSSLIAILVFAVFWGSLVSSFTNEELVNLDNPGLIQANQSIYMKTEDPKLLAQNMIQERIKPVGRINFSTTNNVVKSSAAQQAPQKIVSVANLSDKGEEIYNNACAACHSSGAMNAPKYGVKKDWATRSDTSLSQFYISAINGKGIMPAKGGRSDLSDAEVKSAVDYIFKSIEQ